MKPVLENFKKFPEVRGKGAASTTSVKLVRAQFSPDREQSGFTLLELTVVLALLVLMMGMVVALIYRLRDGGEGAPRR